MRARRCLAALAAIAAAATLQPACNRPDDSPPIAAGREGTYAAEIRWGGAAGTWLDGGEVALTADDQLSIGQRVIVNPTFAGDTVSWTQPDGNGSNGEVTFMEGSATEYFWGQAGYTGWCFEGYIQYPGEGGLDFRGVKQ